MKRCPQLYFIVVGLALFSMFFGSGNLIFPLYLGQITGDSWLGAFAGFCATAVILPLLAVFAIVLYRGHYEHFFSHFGKIPALLIPLALLTVWIPLGSAPRCVALAHASMLPYVNESLPLWGFSVLYSLGVFWMVWRKNAILDILGYVLTPLLLTSLGVIIFQGVSFWNLNFHWEASSPAALRGLMEGYNTMDLIAAFFFSASVVEMLRNSSHDESLSLSTTLKASFVAAGLLGLVYFGLICLSVSHVEVLQSMPKEQLFVQAAKSVLGPQLGIIAAFAVFSACLTTSMALASVYAEFIANRLLGDASKYSLCLVGTQIITFAMSITGLEGITFVTEPLLQILYPLLLLLIVFNLVRKAFMKETMVPAVD
jgi:LIVCS family branched-chain amino acid:cation transporter